MSNECWVRVKQFRVQPSGCSCAGKKQAKAWTLNFLTQTNYSSLMTHHFVDRRAQFVDLNASQTFVNHFAFRVVKKRSRQGATPLRIYHIDSWLGIRKVQQV